MKSRTLVGGALAVVAIALVLVAFGGTRGARAADGDSWLLGSPNRSTQVTDLQDNTSGGQALEVTAEGDTSSAIVGGLD